MNFVRYANLTAAKRECPLSMGWVFISQVDRREKNWGEETSRRFFPNPQISTKTCGTLWERITPGLTWEGGLGRGGGMAGGMGMAGVAYEEQMQ
jgi:hypothetical protein